MRYTNELSAVTSKLREYYSENKLGYRKMSCFLCGWDNRAKQKHWIVRTEIERKIFVPLSTFTRILKKERIGTREDGSIYDATLLLKVKEVHN